MRKVLTIALTATLALVLGLGVALPGLAADDEPAAQAEHKPQDKFLRGTVAGVDEDQEFFTIKAGERSVDIDVNEGTKYFLLTLPRRPILLRLLGMEQLKGKEEVQLRVKPSALRKLEGMDQAPPLKAQRADKKLASAQIENRGLAPDLASPGEGGGIAKLWRELLKLLRRFGQEASFDDIAVGGQVVVQVVSKNDNPLAKLVLIIKPAAQQRVVGTILDIDEDDMTITIEPASATEDSTMILNYDNDTIFVLHGTPSLEEGMKAVAIYVETDNGLLAKRVTARVPPEPAE